MSTFNEVSSQTLDTIKQVQGQTISKATTVSTSTGLVRYDLQAPAKNLYPVTTPISKRLPRVAGDGGIGTNWVSVTGIVGSGYDGMGWVPEGGRAGAMSINTVNKSALYRTLGEETSLTFEAVNASRNFEDVKASSTRRMLQKLMLKQEAAIIGGNNSVALGTTPTPTATIGTGGSLAAITYSVICVAATYEGLQNWKGAGSSVTGGISQTITVTGQDGKTFTLNGGYAQKSANATQAITGTQSIVASVAPVAGAFAYFWYVGAAGSEKLEQVTTVAQVTVTSLLGTGQLASALASTDYSQNSNYAFDGLLTIASKTGSGSYFKALANGSTLTSSGRGSIVEIDNMLQAMYDANQVSPDVLYIGSQVYKNMLDKIFSNGSGAPLVRFNLDAMGKTPTPVAGQALGVYTNPFQNDGALTIPIVIHPLLPAGTILGYNEKLPVAFESPEVPNVAEIHYRQDYYQLDYPLVTREYRMGVYVEETLAVYFNPGIGVISNITAG